MKTDYRYPIPETPTTRYSTPETRHPRPQAPKTTHRDKTRKENTPPPRTPYPSPLAPDPEPPPLTSHPQPSNSKPEPGDGLQRRVPPRRRDLSMNLSPHSLIILGRRSPRALPKVCSGEFPFASPRSSASPGGVYETFTPNTENRNPEPENRQPKIEIRKNPNPKPQTPLQVMDFSGECLRADGGCTRPSSRNPRTETLASHNASIH